MKKVSIMTMNSAMNLYLTAVLFGLMNRFILTSGVIYRADVHHGFGTAVLYWSELTFKLDQSGGAAHHHRPINCDEFHFHRKAHHR